MASTKKDDLTETASQYKWTLYNFSSFNELSPGECICSQTFLSNGIKWNIRLYPNGEKEDNRGYFTIFLHCLNNIKITADCEFTMSNNAKVYSSKKFKGYTYQCDQNEGCGFYKFIDHKTVFTDFKEKNDTLTIVVKISLSTATQETNYLNLQQDLGLLLKTGENSDVILVSRNKKKYKAHKAILACRSKVFSAMFQHNMEENRDNIVNIKDVDNETLEAMLYFVYKGELVPMMKKISKKLLVAADKYELNELKRMCINYLHTNMDFDNVLDLIKTADTYNISELKLKAKEFFIQNCEEILSTKRRENLKDLSRDIVEDLLCDLASSNNERLDPQRKKIKIVPLVYLKPPGVNSVVSRVSKTFM